MVLPVSPPFLPSPPLCGFGVAVSPPPLAAYHMPTMVPAAGSSPEVGKQVKQGKETQDKVWFILGGNGSMM